MIRQMGIGVMVVVGLALGVAAQDRSPVRRIQPPATPPTAPQSTPDMTPAPAEIPEDAPILSIDHENLDLGKIKEGEIKEFVFQLTNTGKSPLILERAKSSCGCTVAQLETKSLDPGATVPLKGTFNSKGRFGAQKKTITIYSNDPQTPVRNVSFEVFVETLYQLKPNRMVTFRDARRGDTIPGTIDLLAGRENQNLEVLDVQFSKPGLTYTSETVENGGFKGHRFSFALDPNVAPGPFASVATVKIRVGDEQADVRIPVNGQVISDIISQPRMLLSMAPVTPGDEIPNGRITLTASTPNKPFSVRRVDAGPMLQYDIEEVRPGLEYRIQFRATEGAAPGPMGQQIRIFTTSDDEPVIEIPAYIQVGTLVDVSPNVVYLRKTPTHPSALRHVTLGCSTTPNFRIEGASSDNPLVRVIVPNDATNSPRSLDVQLAEGAPVGEHVAVITVHTNVEKSPQVLIRVFAEVSDHDEVIPQPSTTESAPVIPTKPH